MRNTVPNVTFLLLRRMRAPLLTLIVVYAVAVLGFVLIPGRDPEGNPWHMDFFHAFYFVSFMGSTIGFGEIPYPFNALQRMWTVVSIYTSVISWLYAIGTLLTNLQDPAFRQAVTASRFRRAVRRVSDPFFLVCGYGDTGSMLVRSLTERGLRAVVIDIDPHRINSLEIENLQVYVPALNADAAEPSALRLAGLEHPCCSGVVALTNDDHVNLKVAITSKLLNAGLPVLCRAESHDAGANMASFGTDHIVNPFDTFAERLAIALESPSMHLVHEWLTSVPHEPLRKPVFPPRGEWVVCGYGRFGKAMIEHLSGEGVQALIVEANPDVTDAPSGTVVGRGTEAHTLQEAGIEDALGIVAGTDDDANNLSIVMTALELNAKLFVVARQNQRENDALFAAARLDLVMQKHDILARRVLALITSPLLASFLRLAREQDDAWASRLAERIGASCEAMAPDIWALEVAAGDAPAVADAVSRGETVTLEEITRSPTDRDRSLPAVPLMLVRGGKEQLLPEGGTVLRLGDRVLFCGQEGAGARMTWNTANHRVLDYLRTGAERPAGFLGHWLLEKIGRY